MAESVIGLYKTQCVHQDVPFPRVDDLELAALGWVYWYNTDRHHSSLNHTTPTGYEQDYYHQKQPPTATAAGRTRPPLNPGRFKRPVNPSLACLAAS